MQLKLKATCQDTMGKLLKLLDYEFEVFWKYSENNPIKCSEKSKERKKERRLKFE